MLRAPAAAQSLDIVRLATPTADERRLDTILNGAGGFIYYVSIAGVTGTKSFSTGDVRRAVARLKACTALPCVVGFGIRTPEQAAEIARFADGAVVGSSIVARIAHGREKRLKRAAIVRDVTDFCATLAQSVHRANREAMIE